jgi:hypothetical protein
VTKNLLPSRYKHKINKSMYSNGLEIKERKNNGKIENWIKVRIGFMGPNGLTGLCTVFYLLAHQGPRS